MWSIQYITGNAREAGIIILEAIFLMEYVICLYLHFDLVSYYSCLSANSSGFCFICAVNGKIFDNNSMQNQLYRICALKPRHSPCLPE